MESIWHPFKDLRYVKFWKIWELFGQIGRDIRRCHQRIWKGYCDYDLFSIDTWFLSVMPRMLEEFKKNRNSSPVAENLISHLMIQDETERDRDVHRKWDEILDRMIFLLGEMDDEADAEKNTYADDYFAAVHNLMQKETRPDGSEVRKYPNLKDYPEYRELSENYHAESERIVRRRMDCKKEFFELYSTWFYDLWD